MSRLEVKMPAQTQAVVEQIYSSMERRIDANPPGLCPVDMTLNFLNLCQAQTCGKCVPCRIGLDQLSLMIREVLDGNPDPDILDRIKTTAQVVVDSADCAIGIDAGQLVLNALIAFRDDFEEHVKTGRCLGGLEDAIPCVAKCPAAVDIPGYVALVNEGRCADAIKLIRKDNPFPVSCAYICEHPCENRCRRKMVDGAINIRGLKRYAVDMAGDVENPPCAEPTGKTVAVVGGGPSGLTAAYYLALMGHKVTVYDMHKKLGGMMRYGIPSYRYPREKLDGEIASILSLGIEAHTETKIGVDISFEELKSKFDAVYVAIGAHTDKKVGIEGEDAKGVISAVEMLRGIGNDEMPDFTGKNVVVIGGGNVAMDCTRSAVRLGAKFVTCVYRRRQEDMTAQAEEVEGAIAEGAEVLTLHAPLKIEVDAEGNAAALWAQPQIIGEMDKAGRPRPNTASADPVRIPADVVIVAIGQAIEYKTFEDAGIKIKWGNLVAGTDTKTAIEGVFSGGDCVTGPATVIRAIAAGKAAAANIDEYLGFNHEIKVDVEVPTPACTDLRPRGRVNCRERAAAERKNDFVCMEHCMTCEEATKESSRCLRCDHFGYGIFKGGRVDKW
ncbi:MAG: FAD-dependent oxidoreductase [Oscillospiraceae bacterium]|nr:FAD-dependent oxidoreductase [Oscillospiraceae bacterium]